MLDWSCIANNWARLYPELMLSAQIKVQASDFVVSECMGFSPCAEGEHVWLSIRKEYQNTLSIAKQLARFAHVPYKNVSYSGLKDYHARTTQWFSVQISPEKEPDWSAFASEGCEVLEVVRHAKKLKIGTHIANDFIIRLRNVSGDVGAFAERIQAIKNQGVPNYFGVQRFGNQFSNLDLATRFLIHGEKVRSTSALRLAMSAVRSWLFNVQVDYLLRHSQWGQVKIAEPVCLDASNSFFWVEEKDAIDVQKRLDNMDCHPSCALWGVLPTKDSRWHSVHEAEKSRLLKYQNYCESLEEKGLKYQRRAARMQVHDLCFASQGNDIILQFRLQRGQFATSVLRELVQV